MSYLQHKIQAIELIAFSKTLSSPAKIVAIAVLCRVINDKSWEGFVTDAELSRILGKDCKTISRAIKQLDRERIFDFERGSRNRATVWKISPSFRKRILQHKKVPDKTVAQIRNDGRQKCRNNPPEMAAIAGQNWPPTKELRKKEERYGFETGQLEWVDTKSYPYQLWTSELRNEFDFSVDEECETISRLGMTYVLLLANNPSRVDKTVWFRFVEAVRAVPKSS